MTTICAVCDQQAVWRWTDTHGIAQCDTCGTPYKLYHYDAENKPIDGRAPECVVLPHWLPLLRRYRTETGKIIPGGYSFPGGQEMASSDDFVAFSKWCEANRDAITAARRRRRRKRIDN